MACFGVGVGADACSGQSDWSEEDKVLSAVLVVWMTENGSAYEA